MDFLDVESVRIIFDKIEKSKCFKHPHKLNNKEHLLNSIDSVLGIDYASVVGGDLGELSKLLYKKPKGSNIHRLSCKPLRKML